MCTKIHKLIISNLFSKLKFLGCYNNGKLEPRAVKCIFLGYKSGVKGYKLWNPETRKVVISRNVVFNEHAMLQDNTIDFLVDGQ